MIFRLLFLVLFGFTFIEADVPPYSVSDSSEGPLWGFYGHRKINKMAVLTLPQQLLSFYKPHIQFVSDHAVDPDKRRYALKGEAFRHYIDIDHWDEPPFDKVPKSLKPAIMTRATVFCINKEDSLDMTAEFLARPQIYDEFIHFDRYSPDIDLDVKAVADTLDMKLDCEKLVFENNFVQYGVLPYFLEDFYDRLVLAFFDKNEERILKISADMGHYIGDAHVPLHTTENYNGQLSGQLGIHAFWESRIPELFADEEYDMLVGRAEYVADKQAYFWEIILASHALLPEILAKEKELKTSFPSDKQYCYDERLQRATWVQCPDYAKAYETALGGTIEKRMQESIKAVGDIWYSAWVDAGQPDLSELNDNLDEEALRKEAEELDGQYKSGRIYGRDHNR